MKDYEIIEELRKQGLRPGFLHQFLDEMKKAKAEYRKGANRQIIFKKEPRPPLPPQSAVRGRSHTIRKFARSKFTPQHGRRP